jgi:hypothetical protein
MMWDSKGDMLQKEGEVDIELCPLASASRAASFEPFATFKTKLATRILQDEKLQARKCIMVLQLQRCWNLSSIRQ